MAPSKAQRSESRSNASRELYLAVDTCRGEHLTRASRDAFLAALIQDKDLEKENGDLYTVTSLKGHLTQRLKQRRNPQYTEDDFWRLGTDYFRPQHLTDIGLPSQSAAPTFAASPSKKRKSPQVIDSDTEDETAVARPAKLAKKTHDPIQTPERTEPDRGRRKRSIEAAELPESGDGKTSEARKRLKLTISSNKPRSGSEAPVGLGDGHQKVETGNKPKTTGTVEELPEPAAAESQQKSPSAQPTSEQPTSEQPTISMIAQEADAIRDSARKRSFSDLTEGKKKTALQNARASYSASLSEAATQQPQDNASTRKTINYDLFPPELPPSGEINTRVRQEIINHVLSGIQNTMEGLCHKSKAIFLNFAMDNDFEHRVPAKVVEDASPALSKLYARVFGTEEWYSEFTRRTLNQSDPWPLAAADVVSSIISAAVFEDVFCARQPWDITDKIKAAVGNEMKYLEEAVDDKGHSLDEVCKQTLYKMVNNKEFQETTIAKHARLLAAKLSTTIAPHLRMHRSAQKPNRDSNSGDDEPGLGPLYTKMVEELFQRALIAKGKMDSYWEARYEYIWPNSGTMMDSEMCTPMPGQNSKNQKIMLTFWPAVRVTSHTYNGGGDDVYYAYQSEVITTNNLE